MKLRYEEIAAQFARSQGFDGVMPYESRFEQPEGVPDGCEWYEAGLFGNCGAAGPSSWHPLFDSTLHCIVADEDGARWRSEKDAITLRRG